MSDIVLLDGGMGQELVRRSSEPAHPQWAAWVMMNEPEIVQAVHEDYLRAGATVLTLNTYSTTPGRFRRFGTSDQFVPQQMRAVEVASTARDSVQRGGVIAGCLPPLGGSYMPDLVPGYDAMVAEYREIVALEAPHVALFICETMSTAQEAKAAATAAAESGKPVWVSWTLAEEPSGDGMPRLRSSETVEEAIAALDGIAVDALLFNCCPPEVMTAGMAILARDGRPFGGHANGFTPIPDAFLPGTTVEMLGTRTDLGPAAYADHVMRWVDAGATIVGGCCEVGPAHIAEIATRLTAAGHKIVAP